MKQISFKRFLVASLTLVGQIYSLYLLFFYQSFEGFIIAPMTLGDTGAPSDVLTYLDSLFAQSLANYRKTLIDNIGAANAFLHKLISSDLYESYDGGTDIRETLMYQLAPSDWYDGYDELPDTPTDGITQAVFEARQMATPVTYSMKEVIQNKHMIISLVKSKITQGEMGIQEGWATAWMQGAGAASLATPKTGTSGASAIDPIARLVHFTPSTSLAVGNINQSTYSWWRNNTKTSSATTYDALILEFLNAFNTASLGTGGAPDLVLVDQTTYEMMSFALYQRYRNTDGEDDFPFTNIKLPFGNKKTLMVMDDKTPDVFSGTLATTTYGTAYFLNTKFARVRYIPERDFEMIENENGKTFVKPPKSDSRLGHIGWMGATTINNRRKFTVLGKIARTLT